MTLINRQENPTVCIVLYCIVFLFDYNNNNEIAQNHKFKLKWSYGGLVAIGRQIFDAKMAPIVLKNIFAKTLRMTSLD